MGEIVGAIARRREQRASPENPSIPLSSADIDWFGGGWGSKSATGVTVNENTARAVSAVYACTRVIAETVSQLPLGVHERNGNRRDPVPDHRLSRKLTLQPNDEMTAAGWKETAQGHACLWGNSYSEIARNGRGEVGALYPLPPNRVEARRTRSGQLVYMVTYDDGKQKPFSPRNILHIPALGGNGITGWSPVRLQRESIGLALATEQHGATFFGNGSRPGGILRTPNKLSEPAAKRMRDDWERQHRGVENSHRVSVMEEDVQWQSIGMPNEDAQFLENRKFQVEEIARWFRVPLHMIGMLDRMTDNNVEELGIDFGKYTMTPWLTKWEQELQIKLLTEREIRQGLYIKFNMGALLRGDLKSRYEAYALGRTHGWLNGNDIRALEDMNPFEGGETYWAPVNMVPADQLGQVQEPPDTDDARKLLVALMEARGIEPPKEIDISIDPNDPNNPAFQANVARAIAIVGRPQLRKTYLPLLEDAARRCLAREANASKRGTKGFYDNHEPYVRDSFGVVLHALMEQLRCEIAPEADSGDLVNFVNDYNTAFAARHCAAQSLDLESTAPDDVAALAEGWRHDLPALIANEEIVRACGAFARAAYIAAGVETLEWVAPDDACRFCKALNGTKVKAGDPFLRKGEAFDAGDGEPLTPERDISHPPLPCGCECDIVAGE